MENLSPDELRARARDAVKKLGGLCEAEDLCEAKALVEALRNIAAYDEMGQLAEAVSRRDPGDARNRRLYAQCLINTGKATAALDLLKPLTQRLPKDDPEFAEAMGLIGRANKQIFFDAEDKAHPAARQALERAIEAYRIPYDESQQKNTWHGVNLLAVLTRARRLGLQLATDLKPKDLAKALVAELEAVPEKDRDPDWYLPTLAEASLGLGDWNTVEENVRAYAASGKVQPFQIESSLRQFTQVWDLESIDERGRGLVATLRARLLQLSGGGLQAVPEELQRWRNQADPEAGQLEAILGSDGPKTYAWWKAGLQRASSVVSVRQKLGSRIGTGFLLRASDLGLTPPDQLVVLTNFHVVNRTGAFGALTPQAAEVVFEAADVVQTLPVSRILWSSPVSRHDASVLSLEQDAAGIQPLPLAADLPKIATNSRVYIIGHPGGEELAFSFQDNEMLDHEGPPNGAPQIPGVCRVHYRAPTKPGSSGSAVFNSDLWQVIALHHKGGVEGMPRLNGKAGSYAANEGISLASIKKAIQAGIEPSS